MGTAQTKNCESPTGNSESATSTRKLRKPNAKQKNSTARAQKSALCQDTALTQNCGSPTENLENQTPRKRCSSPMRNKTTKLTARAQKSNSLAPLKQKTTKAQQETPKAQLGHENFIARAQQNVSLSPPRPQKLRKPNRTPQKPNSNKKMRKPDAKQKH
jgi:hypothetical protein